MNKRQFFAHSCAVLLVASLFFFVVTAATASGQARRKAHAHGRTADVLADVAADVSISAVDAPDAAHRENVATSKDGRYVAYTTSGDGERLFVEDTRQGVTYEITGIPMPHRPFSDLAWAGRRLVFDRWSQPHQGLHYEVDVTIRTLVVAGAFPDR